MTTRNYEAMFILDNNAATADFEATAGKVDAILEKHGATIVQKEKWDERKLAYEIKGRRRGTYYLTYFQAAPTAISRIHEDVHLTEDILRHLVLVLDLPIQEHIDKRNEERELLAEDSRKNSLGGWGDRRRSRSGPSSRRGDDARDEERSGRPSRADEAHSSANAREKQEEKPAAPKSEKTAAATAEPAPVETAAGETSNDGSDA